MKPLKQKVSITLDDDILQKIKILADNSDRSLSQYINLILRNHVKDCQKQLMESENGTVQRDFIQSPRK